MLKKIFIAACLFIAFKAAAQNQIVVRGDTLVLPSGSKFWLGEQITLKSGSLPNGTFNYIYYPIPLDIAKGKPLKAFYSGRTATIEKFEKDKSYKNSYSYNILVINFGDRKKFWCDVLGALSSNEITDPNGGAAKGGPADSREARLAKLKKAYDDGDITKEDYESLKAKIMNEKDSSAPAKKNDGPVVF